MRKTIIALTAAGSVAALSATGAIADTHEHGQHAMDTSAIESGTYSTDPAHTLVEWRVSHFGFNDYFGLFGDAEGTLVLDTADMANSSVDVRLPISSLAVVSEGLREHMLRPGEDGAAPDFFGPDADDARFVSSSVEQTGPTTANITGALTLNGQTGPVTIAAELSGMGENPRSQAQTVGFHGTTTIKRSEWGMDFAVPAIGDEVELDITVAFEKN
ncbi:YceI family protein [Aurantiacibacter aquimixticola]|uniref:YceI family protein n=1 Tax=Aurantiacibacter aquimixticola TaxID=1958945 RepID=A0A419RRJ4_9SPHN|nr:YceI family protein [Aurantiacibacter aquimixticola]RJY08389.1 YceI family protein [Aurantiacibacter aquimixticola]